jgi:hypothetical protein
MFTLHMQCDMEYGLVVLRLKYPIAECLDLIFQDYFNHETLLIYIQIDDLIPLVQIGSDD